MSWREPVGQFRLLGRVDEILATEAADWDKRDVRVLEASLTRQELTYLLRDEFVSLLTPVNCVHLVDSYDDLTDTWRTERKLGISTIWNTSLSLERFNCTVNTPGHLL